MKKLISLTLALLMLLSLAACGNPEGDDQPASSGTFAGNSPADNPTGTDVGTEADTLPPEMALPQDQVRILVWKNDPDVVAREGTSSVLSDAMADRDAALEAVWGCKPTYILTDNAYSELFPLYNVADDICDLCIMPLRVTIDKSISGQFVGYALDDFGLDLENGIWDQGMSGIVINGEHRFAAPAVSVAANDSTYAVFYDSKADAGTLSARLSAMDNGWTWDEMTAMLTEAEGADPNGNGAPVPGMVWDERTFSALVIGAGLRPDSDLADQAEDYVQPMIDYAASGKVAAHSILDDSPFKAGGRVFSIGKLEWLYDKDAGSVYDRVTVMPIPKQSADQTRSLTTSFAANCLIIPHTKMVEPRVPACASAMYVFAAVTAKTMEKPYLDQLVPASNAVSRRNVEELLASRDYDLALNGTIEWRLSGDTLKTLKSFFGFKRVELKSLVKHCLNVREK